MKIHEYQAKEILREYGVKTLEGVVCHNVEDAVAAAERLGFPCVIKAQIHAGGRGKGGGVKLAKNIEEAKAHADAILGMQLKTHQKARLLVFYHCRHPSPIIRCHFGSSPWSGKPISNEGGRRSPEATELATGEAATTVAAAAAASCLHLAAAAVESGRASAAATRA